MTAYYLLTDMQECEFNVEEYFTCVFGKIIEGEKDYEKLLLSAIAR